VPSRPIDIERHNAAQVAYFEEEMTRHTRLVPSHAHYVRRQVDEVLAAADVRPGDRVLEAGCGMGRHTFEVARRGVVVEGLDLSGSLLARLKEFDAGRYGFALHEGDALHPPRELVGRFKAVIGWFVLHHLPYVDQGLKALAELVEPGGTMGFLEPNPYNPLYYVQIFGDPNLNWGGDRGIMNMVPGKVLSAIRDAGLEPGPVRRFGFLPPGVVNRPRGRVLESVVENLPGVEPIRAFRVFLGRGPAAGARPRPG
jgi:SAM-dependent methyltransferase